MATSLPSGVSEHIVDTPRIRMRYTPSGDEEVVYDGAGHGPFINPAEESILRLLSFVNGGGQAT